MIGILLQIAFIVVPTGTNDKAATWDYPELSAGIVDEFRLYVKYIPSFQQSDPMPVVSPVSDTLVGNVSATDPDLRIPLGSLTQPGAYFFVATAYDADSDVESEASNILPLFAMGAPLNLKMVGGGSASNLKTNSSGLRLVEE